MVNLVKTELDVLLRNALPTLSAAELRPALMAYVDHTVLNGLSEIRAEISGFRDSLPEAVAQAVRSLAPKQEPVTPPTTHHANPQRMDTRNERVRAVEGMSGRRLRLQVGP